ncbi:MAG: hypothetical protein Q7S09_02775 [bacterium]|nr:hypothetical protein [bacterium]
MRSALLEEPKTATPIIPLATAVAPPHSNAVTVTIGDKSHALPFTPGMTVEDALKTVGGAKKADGSATVNERASNGDTVLQAGDLVVLTPKFENGGR